MIGMLKKIISLMRVQPEGGALPSFSTNELVPPTCDEFGYPWARLIGGTGGGAPVSITGTSNPGDNRLGAGISILDTGAFLYGFDGVNFDRIRAVADNADAQTAAGLGALLSLARLQGWNGATFDRIRALADNADTQTAAGLGALLSLARLQGWNGNTYDRWRNNTEHTILASAVRNTTTQSADFVNYNGRGLHLIFDVTAVPGVDTVTPVIQGKNPVTGTYYDIAVGPVISTTGTTIMKIYPGITVSTTEFSDIIPRTWRLQVIHSGAGNFTYSAGGNVVL